MQQQNGQQRPPLAATHDQRPTTTKDLKPAQQTEFHRDRPHPTLRPCSGSWQLATTTRGEDPFDDRTQSGHTPAGSGLAVFIVRVVDGPVRDAGFNPRSSRVA